MWILASAVGRSQWSATMRTQRATAECVLIGDSTTDMQAAALAGTASIGYANKPGKPVTLAAAGAATIVSSLAEIVLALRARPLPN